MQSARNHKDRQRYDSVQALSGLEAACRLSQISLIPWYLGGGFQKWAYPQIIPVMNDHFRLETHGDLGIVHFKKHQFLDIG